MTDIPPPPMDPMPTSPPRVDVSGKVKGPAIGLMATAIIGFLLQLKSLIFPTNVEDILILMEELSPDFDTEQYADVIEMATSGNVIFILFGMALCVLVFFGGMKMMNMQSWGLALAASIVALIPCTSPCCCLGLPIGIWAIIVLMDSAVKDAFEFQR